MDLQDFPTDELLRTAIKSEEDSFQLYSTLNDYVKEEFLTGKLKFLAGEEKKHRAKLERIYFSRFPDRELEINDIATDVPLPLFKLDAGYHPVEDVLEKAMESELITSDFYSSWNDLIEDDQEISDVLSYLTSMERSHYEILKKEKERLEEGRSERIHWSGN